ncbi:MAG TPA: PPOX class F420-dependent oxidoreductase [Actinocrinis sp.]|uniref:PPOX class F420-dependent oxidoreductase n=1 Tax=Actinocrinis sp. TaxID=1920516 RepID=UPI002DDD5B8F|nr:PPOX class F420-dependent oxidoreductase [Actinocrinis sp.]HEV2342982.1 PPOX class F420-dependent oxidoreductase [Actinocrinis sp.]
MGDQTVRDTAVPHNHPVQHDHTAQHDQAERIARAREFVAANSRGVLTTYRRDGQAQMSPVTAGVDAEGRIVISVTEDRAKTKNARRDPRVALCVFIDDFYGPWAQVEGLAEFADGPDRIDALVDYYRTLRGEHPDWSEYRAAMVRDRRVLLRFAILRASGPAAG